MSIEVRNITKNFGSFTALRNVSLTVPTGELVALLGPSGCGKTTLLRIVAGLEEADDGSVIFFGEDTKDLRVRERRVGYVFQHYALFRHMTVFDNIAFGLNVKPRRHRPSRGEIRDRVHELLRLVQLEGMANRYPSQLSGGQRQRIALARALAVKPSVLLLDEPFGALDARVRQELRRWLRRLHDELRVTSVFVTHDQDEALEVADRVVVMHHGRVEQIGTPEEVYDQPATPFVYGFLGSVNLFHGRLADGRVRLGATEHEAPGMAEAADGPALAFVRTHEVEIAVAPNGSTFEAVVSHARALGPSVRVELESPGHRVPIEAELTRERFEELKLRRDASYVFFADDIFTANKRRTKELLSRMVAEGVTPQWGAQVRTETVDDPEVLHLMRQSHCFNVYVGFESINPRTLKLFQKKQDLGKIERSIERFHKLGVIASMQPCHIVGDIDAAVAQAVQIANNRKVETRDGRIIDVRADTICVHGDTPGSDRLAANIRAGLERDGRVERAVAERQGLEE